MWSEIWPTKAQIYRREYIGHAYDNVRVPPRSQKYFHKGVQTMLPSLPRTIDISQCPYCSSYTLLLINDLMLPSHKLIRT